MGATDPGSAREEAERLVATALAAARLAAAGAKGGQWGPLGGIMSSVLGHSGSPGGSAGTPPGGFATGAAECCVCPVCRGISALRDPSPEFAERLATGAGDLAAGVASLLRAFAPSEPSADAPAGPAATRGQGGGDDHVWREATRSGHDSQPAPERDVWSAATRAEDPAAPAVVPPVDVAGQAATATVRTSTDGPVVPASRAPGDEGERSPGDGA
ncbi:hypothetical protein AB0I85_11070 [Micromonospora echinofusca]|uniref:hypothetical protein n=1 Tax=Micromonospora echinofusca TaxID=47858 RepID=UPI002022091B|nr:hypothetical protein [Micromonospora sp. MSM11]MCL7457910.1 hypothetical protein [Micromonospora sp. MSM11]